MCRECSKCVALHKPSVRELSGGSLAVGLGTSIIPDKFETPRVEVLAVRNSPFLDAMHGLYEDAGGLPDLLPREVFEQHFAEHFGKLRTDTALGRLFFYYTPSQVHTLTIMDKQLATADLTPARRTLSEYLSEPVPTTDDPAQNACGVQQAFRVTIRPANVKAGVSEYLPESVDVLLISQADCASSGFSVRDLVPELSYSLVLVLVSSYLRDVLFSFLNNKKLLDMVQFDQVPKFESYSRIKDFFRSTSCFLLRRVYSPRDAFESNSRVRRLFVRGYDARFADSALLSADAEFWRSEVKRQSDLKFPRPLLLRFGCRYNFTVPEYLVVFSLAFTCVTSALLGLFVYARGCLSKPTFHRAHSQLVRLGRFCQRVFMRTVLLVYYYNAIQFLTFVTQVRSYFFSVYDFGVVSMRSALVVYPLLKMLEQLSEPHLPDQSRAQNTQAKPTACAVKTGDIQIRHKAYAVEGVWARVKHLVLVLFRIRRQRRPVEVQRRRRLARFESKLMKAKLKLRSGRRDANQSPTGSPPPD